MVPETLILQIIGMGAVLIYSLLGEIISERSGVVNLSIEGSIAFSAATSYAITVAYHNPLIGLLFGVLSGIIPSIFMTLTSVYMPLNMIVSGIVFSSIFSAASIVVGNSVPRLPQERLVFINENTTLMIIFLSAVSSAIVLKLFIRRRIGLLIRSAGEDPYSAYSLGINPWRIRMFGLIFSGAMGGLTGSLLTLSPMISMIWRENITAGTGFIIVAVTPSTLWDPIIAIFIGIFFGSIPLISIYLQTSGMMFSAELASLLPYLIALSLYIIFRIVLAKRSGLVPRALGKEIVLEERYE